MAAHLLEAAIERTGAGAIGRLGLADATRSAANPLTTAAGGAGAQLQQEVMVDFIDVLSGNSAGAALLARALGLNFERSITALVPKIATAATAG